MPSRDQLKELFTECTYEWKNADWDGDDSLAGYMQTSKANGNKLFLPVAGSRWDSDLYDIGSDGYYWSTELYSGLSDIARYLRFYSGHWSAGNRYNRSNGFSVRPVCPSTK